ncbi:MAG: ABC transporter substrate-binding protein [Beijerinckiaceae bacterium]
MDEITRRSMMAAMASGALGAAWPAAAQAKPLKLLLNTSLSGPVSFFLLAEDRGYLKESGLSVAFSAGGGAAVVVPQVRHGSYDAGYGDMTALIERIARGPRDEGPVAVYTTFNTVPFTIAVSARGPIRSPSDLVGRRLIGHPVDAALVTFDMFAQATGIDAAKVGVERAGTSMGSQVADMLSGRGADGVFGFVNTIIASIAPLGIDAAKDLRFINYADHLPDMYGNTLFVTRELYRDDPGAISGLVRAFNRGLNDTVQNPAAAIDALQKRVTTRREVDHTRLVGTLRSEMAHPEGARIGIGDMDDGRLGRLIDLVVRTKKLPRTPAIGEVFDRRFLPPAAERIRSLART